LEGLDVGLGIQVRRKCIDVQIAEALIDEESLTGYDLETLAQRYLGKGKDEELLKQAADAYGVHPKSGLWKLPSKYVGAYAEYDAMAALRIFEKQLKKLQEEELLPIFELESKLLPLLWQMRKIGIPVSLDRATELTKELLDTESAIRDKLFKEHNCRIDEWSGQQIASLCDRLKINYPRTDRGNPSFTGDFLAENTNPLLRDIAEIRELNRLRKTFIDDWIFGNQINGWIHPQWKQLKSDNGGTRTGRMAASNPNPQQVPGRSDIAAKVRKLFCPPPGEKWAKIDYSQQEPRLLVHFASLCGCTGAALVKMAYCQNPKMDIYQFLAESCNMKRRDAKDATLGRMYGMGGKRFAERQGISVDEANSKLHAFDNSVPFVREVSDLCATTAANRGYIKTLLGRRRHFNLWEPSRYSDNYEYAKPLPRAQAEEMWKGERLRRYGTHKALNALIQGSAADMTKAALVLIYETCGKLPYMAVHDELDFGVTDEAEAMNYKRLAETCVKLEVPIIAELCLGDSWK